MRHIIGKQTIDFEISRFERGRPRRHAPGVLVARQAQGSLTGPGHGVAKASKACKFATGLCVDRFSPDRCKSRSAVWSTS